MDTIKNLLPNIPQSADELQCVICGKPVTDARGIKNAVCSLACQDEKKRRDVEEKQRAEEEAHRQEFATRCANASQYLKSFGVPKRYLDCSFDNFKPKSDLQMKALETLKTLSEVNGFLLMHGKPGAGKTHLTVSVIRRLMCCCKATIETNIYSTTKTIAFWPASEILLSIRQTFDGGNEGRAMEVFTSNNLLVIDDLGVEKPSEWALQTWYAILDGRYREMRPTIITSNLSLVEIAERYGDRIASRLSTGMILKIEGPDFRVKS